MNRYAILLKGINVGTTNRITSSSLIQFFERQGFNEVSTYLNSGNIIVCAQSDVIDSKISQLEKEMLLTLSLKTVIFVVTSKDIDETLTNVPKSFGQRALENPKALNIYFFKKSIGTLTKGKNLMRYLKNDEDIHLTNSNLYYFCEKGLGESKLTTRVIEKILDIEVTARNHRTVLALKKRLS